VTFSPRAKRADLAERIRRILSDRGLVLAEVSRQSQTRFARNRAFRIPENFYDALRRPSFTPRLQQLYALSVVSGYRLTDWLALFDISFDDASAFQASLPSKRTIELDARLYDKGASVSWYVESPVAMLGTTLTPLSDWLSGALPRTVQSLTKNAGPCFRYVKIGSQDAYAFPDLLPGSIARIDSRLPSSRLLAEDRTERILAIEHQGIIVCGQVRHGRKGRIVLCSRHLPYAPAELQLGTDARILGYVDMEIRRVVSHGKADVRASWSRTTWDSVVPGTFGELLRWARRRAGLSFREASEHTAEIARSLGHAHYFCAASTLSDLETANFPPRHVRKLISLSAIYGIAMQDLADYAGCSLQQAGQDPLPAHYRNNEKNESAIGNHHPSPFLSALETELEELPFFLRNALPLLLGRSSLSVRDLFWAGLTSELLHPYLRGAVFLAIDGRSTIPVTSLPVPVWAQPLYVLEFRDGSRCCAPCRLENRMLVVHRCTRARTEILQFRYPADVEIRGRVTVQAATTSRLPRTSPTKSEPNGERGIGTRLARRFAMVCQAQTLPRRNSPEAAANICIAGICPVPDLPRL
jgi:hypothetical protein